MQSDASEFARVVGFTLIELSIVLVIIGLIVGGILVGQELIRAAEVRATISQLEKYNTAVNTFRGKYNNQIPGDMSEPDATRFGFSVTAPRGTAPGEGDGNGMIQSFVGAPSGGGQPEVQGESAVFWVDLSTAGLIDGGFHTGSETTGSGSVITLTSTPSVNDFYPQAKLGNGNYFYVWNGTLPAINSSTGNNNMGNNYFGIAAVSVIECCGFGEAQSGLTVAQAYAIDKKIDDGLPQTGNVVAVYMAYCDCPTDGLDYWAAGGGLILMGPNHAVPTNAPFGNFLVTTGSAYSCFDARGVNGGPTQYSMGVNNGNGVNCALSFAFQ